jgi:hypothetical protein
MDRSSSARLVALLSRWSAAFKPSRPVDRAARRTVEQLESRMMLSGSPTELAPNMGFEDGTLSSWTASPAQDGGISVEMAMVGLSGRSYTAPQGNHFALLTPGAASQFTTLSRDFQLAAGQALSGWAFFDGRDFLPFDDNGQVFIRQGNVILFSESIASVGDLGGTGWTSFSYTAATSGTYTLVARVENVADDSAPSFLGLDNVPLTRTTPTVQVSDSGGTYTGNSFAATSATVTGTPADGTIATSGDTPLDSGTLSFAYSQNIGTDAAPVWSALPGAPADAGSYEVVAHYTSDNPNYTDADSSPVQFTIARADPVFSFSGAEATYDGQAHGATGIATDVESPNPADLSASLSLSYDWTDPTGSDHGLIAGTPVRAGSYQVLASFAGNGDYNSVATFDTGKQVLIDQAALTVTATAQSKTYDGTTAASLVARSISGVVGNDDVSVVGGTPSFDTPDVGTSKTVTLTDMTLAGADAGNYSVNSTATATAAIAPAHLTVAAISNCKTYGSVATEGGMIWGVQAGDAIAASFFSSGDSAGADAGSYAIAAALSDGGSGKLARDYVIDSILGNVGTLLVNQAHLTVSANARAKAYGQPTTESGSVGGIRNGDRITAGFSSAGDSAAADVGSYPIPATLSDGGTGKLARDYVVDSNLANTGTLAVNPAAAQVVYSGDSFATAGTTGAAAIALQAQIKDNSGGAGSATHAAVTFQIYLSGNLVATVPGSAVSLMNATDPTLGISSASWSVNLGGATAATYRVVVVLGNDYAGSTGIGDLVTVSLPSKDQSTGGGYLVLNASGGSYAADSGSRIDFGFNLSDATGTAGGHVNIIFRRTAADGLVHTYQIKSTSISAYGADSSTGQANSLALATLTDVTNSAHPLVVATGLTLQMSLTDGGAGSGSDALAISLWSGSSLLFSTDWTGLQTLQQTLSGGNLQVH